MTPKNSPEFEGQGAFFNEKVEASGTDPELRHKSVTLEPVPEGVYPEAAETAQPATTLQPDVAAAIDQSVSEANKSARRRRAQLGRHSPLERENGGSYLALKVGDFLPGFGPVTYTNFEDARRHAQGLEDKR